MKEELEKMYVQALIDDLPTNVFAEHILRLFSVSGRSEQFVCLCPRTKEDNCSRKEPCKECETCPHFRQTNCH